MKTPSKSHSESIDYTALSVEQLVALLQKKDQQTAALEQQFQSLQQQLDWFKRQLFGQKSEKRNFEDNPYQTTIAELLKDVPAVPEITEEKQTISYERGKAKKNALDNAQNDSGLRFDDSVPVEEIQIEAPELKGANSDDYIVIDPPYGDCLSLSIGPEITNPTLTKWREPDARFRYVNPTEVRLGRGRILSGNGMTPLLEAREGVVMAHLADGGYVGTVLAFGLEHSDWPSRPSFVMFVRNLVHHARSPDLPSWSPRDESGDYSLSLPAHVDAIRLRLPNGTRRELMAAQAELVLAEYGQPGFYYVSWTGPRAGSALLGLSVLHATESNPNLTRPTVIVGGEPKHKPQSPPHALSAGFVVLGLLAMSIPLTRMGQVAVGSS